MLRKTLLLLPTLLIGMLVTATVQSATLAPAAREHDSPEQLERIKARLDHLHERLEIKATQQAAWDAFAAKMEALPGPHATAPGPNADPAAALHFRAEIASEMADRLSAMADATEKLESVLTADQRKILAEESAHIPRSGHP